MIHKTASNLVKATKVPRSSKSRVSTQEKRARRYRSVQNRDFRDRIGRVFSQRMYLDNQEDFPADSNILLWSKICKYPLILL